jgi:hypothetical protein
MTTKLLHYLPATPPQGAGVSPVSVADWALSELRRVSTVLQGVISQVATNEAAIATNASDIATNAGDISTNAGNISTNTSDISSINSLLDSLGLSSNFLVVNYIERGYTGITTSTYTVLATDTHLNVTYSSGTCTITLPAASSYTGREIYVKTQTTNVVSSASSNVVSMIGGSPGTDILNGASPAAGAWVLLVSNGTYWKKHAVG